MARERGLGLWPKAVCLFSVPRHFRILRRCSVPDPRASAGSGSHRTRTSFPFSRGFNRAKSQDHRGIAGGISSVPGAWPRTVHHPSFRAGWRREERQLSIMADRLVESVFDTKYAIEPPRCVSSWDHVRIWLEGSYRSQRRVEEGSGTNGTGRFQLVLRRYFEWRRSAFRGATAVGWFVSSRPGEAFRCGVKWRAIPRGRSRSKRREPRRI